MRTFLILLIVLFFSCSKSDEYYTTEIFEGQFLNIYGNWQLMLSGDISKKALSITNQNKPGGSLFCEKLNISRIGKYNMFNEGNLTETGRIIIRKQKKDTLLFYFEPDDIYKTNYLINENYLEFIGSDTMFLKYTPLPDMNRHFKRIK